MHTMSPDDYYTDVIVKPQVVRKVGILPLQRDTEENEVWMLTLRRFFMKTDKAWNMSSVHNIFHYL